MGPVAVIWGPPMYLCICNALSETRVRKVVDGGARCLGEVYLALGCKPQCGKCVDEVRAMLPAAERDRLRRVSP